MSKSHGPYAAEFRQQMIELVKAGRNPNELAHEFGCHVTSITNWLRTANVQGSGARTAAAPLCAGEREELIQLRCQLRQVRQERDILAKATAWFANNGATFTTSTR